MCCYVSILHKFDMDSLFAIHYDGRWSQCIENLIDIENPNDSKRFNLIGVSIPDSKASNIKIKIKPQNNSIIRFSIL